MSCPEILGHQPPHPLHALGGGGYSEGVIYQERPRDLARRRRSNLASIPPTVTVQGTDKVLPPEPIEKNTLRHPLMSRTRKPVQRILQKNSRILTVRIYRVNTKDGYGYSSPGSFF